MKLNYNHTRYASYIGYVVQAVVNNLAPLLFLIFHRKYGISLEKITLLVTVNFSVQLLVDLLSARFVDKIGYRKAIIGAHISAAIGLVGLSVFPAVFPSPYIGLLTAVVFYAVGGGLLEVLVSPIVEACPTENKAGNMSLLHSFYCWGSVLVIFVSTLFLIVFGKESYVYLTPLWAILPAVNAVYFSKVPINTLADEGKTMSISELFRTRIFYLFLILMTMSGAAELSMSQWASAFAEDALGVSKTAGDLMGPCMFAVLMGISRVLYAKISHRVKILPFMICSAVLCIISYLLASLSPNSLMSLVGCALCGFSVGIMWPGTFSMASERIPMGGNAMFALLALAGDLGCSGGPTAVGFISGQFGGDLKKGLMFAAVFPFVMVIGCVKNKFGKR